MEDFDKSKSFDLKRSKLLRKLINDYIIMKEKELNVEKEDQSKNQKI